MYSVILATTTRFLLPLILLFSVFLLLRGHNMPGGGFVGGLVAATGFALHALAHDVSAARRVLRVDPKRLLSFGLLVAVASGCLGAAIGEPFMTALWLPQALPVLGKFGTPVLFDLGVYLVVCGVALTIVFTLME
jgi:multicomponent Na+:H+ antiporter subunit B